MRPAVALLVFVSASGCAAEATECCIAHTMPASPPCPVAMPATGLSVVPSSPVLVLQSSHIDRLTEVVGVIDVHSEMGGHDAALDLLKMRAAQLGADAVLGVEFHHGHGEDEPTHLSGLAVRFVDEDR
jgi:hypothetical protein